MNYKYKYFDKMLFINIGLNFKNNIIGSFHRPCYAMESLFIDLEAPVGTYEFCSYCAEQVKQPP